jgi:hypothetical protein
MSEILSPMLISRTSCAVVLLLWIGAGCTAQPVPVKDVLASGKDSLAFGAAVDGLRLSLSLTANAKPSPSSHDLVIYIQNVGNEDLTINLGDMLGNGKVQLPYALSLTTVDSQGRPQSWKFLDRRYPGIAGRVDPYVLPLKTEAIYSLRLSEGLFFNSPPFQYLNEMPPGRYLITARFVDTLAHDNNIQSQDIKLMHFWNGSIQSNTVMWTKK